MGASEDRVEDSAEDRVEDSAKDSAEDRAEASGDASGDDGCANFTLPQLSPAQLASLLPLAHQYNTEGFSLDLGGLEEMSDIQ